MMGERSLQYPNIPIKPGSYNHSTKSDDMASLGACFILQSLRTLHLWLLGAWPIDSLLEDHEQAGDSYCTPSHSRESLRK